MGNQFSRILGFWVCLGSLGSWLACTPAFVKENRELGKKYLEQFPNASRSYTLQRSGSKTQTIHYVVGGTSGKTKVIFIHGSPGSWDAFVKYLVDPELTQEAYLISADRPGYGGSGAGHPETSLSEQAEALLPLLSIDKSDAPAILVGHSYGGPVVTKMAMTQDRRLKSIIILAGSVDPALEKKKWFQYPADLFFIRWLMPSSLDVCNQEIEGLKPELEAMVPHWADIRSSVVVIQGMEDDLVPPSNADFIEKMTRPLRPKISRIPGLNHFIPWLRPDLVKAAILEEIHSSR